MVQMSKDTTPQKSKLKYECLFCAKPTNYKEAKIGNNFHDKPLCADCFEKVNRVIPSYPLPIYPQPYQPWPNPLGPIITYSGLHYV